MQTWSEKERAYLAATLKANQDAIAQAEKERAELSELRWLAMPERIKRILRALPEADRVKPRGIDFFVEQLKPRYSGRRASPRDVGLALRSLGWTRHRCWRRLEGDEQGFRALWMPPECDPTGASSKQLKTPYNAK